jgi:hypothetical protein
MQRLVPSWRALVKRHAFATSTVWENPTAFPNARSNGDPPIGAVTPTHETLL